MKPAKVAADLPAAGLHPSAAPIGEATPAPPEGGRRHFLAMAAAYALGVFNDNFFKQAALLLAVATDRSYLQGIATAIFALPFLLFAAPAGWMADRFSKRSVVILAKFLELAAMICGAIGLWRDDFTLVLVMLAVMGVQATIFSPALNGALAEIYPARQVLNANAILRTAVTANILLGVVMAGFALERGRAVVAVAVVAVSLFGILASLGVPRRPSASPGAPFPWTGPLDTLRELHNVRKDALLAVAIVADTFVWFGGSVQVLLLNQLGLIQFKLGEATTSRLVAAELVGFAVGGAISSRTSRGPRWQWMLAPSALLMGAFMIAMAWIPGLPAERQGLSLFAVIALIGIAGGTIMVPCETFIQVRPPAARKGAVIAAANFAAFTGVLLSGPVANLLNARCTPTAGFAVLGAIACLLALGLFAVFAFRWAAPPPSERTAGLRVLARGSGRSSPPGPADAGEAER